MMKALRAVSHHPSLIKTKFSKQIFNFPYTLRRPHHNSTQFTKPIFKTFTTITPSPFSTEEEDDKFDWYSAWYAIMPVCDLDKRAPHGKKVMGLDVVVWWDKNVNAWNVFEDTCPHRLAPLSQGRIDQSGRLQCVYHGWCFAASG
nr:putative Rieske [2Fe-2S] iron-sulfur domain-containing protein [Tanacetum cinerariifolium]